MERRRKKGNIDFETVKFITRRDEQGVFSNLLRELRIDDREYSNYCLTLFDLGHYGSENDSGLLAKSEMRELIETKNWNS